MAVPLIYAVARANPEHRFTFLTQPFLTALLADPPANLEAMAIDIKREEKSIPGLIRYADRLRREQFDVVVDIHNVLRTRFLRASLWFSGVRTASISKPRRARRRLIAAPPKKLKQPLPHMLELERQTLRSVGLQVPEEIPPVGVSKEEIRSFFELHPDLAKLLSGSTLIGIAPFASTDAKTYSLEQMEEVVARLSRETNFRILLFGGRGREAEVLKSWQSKYPRVHSVAGSLELSQEITLISLLSCMVSMDSANAHFASMVGVRVVSLWCATHPYAGFVGLGQREVDCLQPDLYCRPCSIFGRVKHCLHGDYRCRSLVSSEVVYQHIYALIHSN